MTAEDKRIYDELSTAKLRKPFVPFVVVLKDGRRLEVNNWLHIAFGEENPRVVVLPNGGVSVFFKRDQIAAIEVLEAAH